MHKVAMDVRSILARISAASAARREESEARAQGLDGPVGRFHEALAAALREHSRKAIAKRVGVTPQAIYTWSIYKTIPRPSMIAVYTERLQEMM